MVLKSNQKGTIFSANEQLFLDFSDSYTFDGIVVEQGVEGEWEWEWEWNCFVPRGVGGGRGGNGCQYAGGARVMLPGGKGRRGGVFEGEEGRKFAEGEPLFFEVKARVRGSGGEVVAEGRWGGVVNPMGGTGRGLEVKEEEWVCGDSSVGYSVSFFLLLLLFS